MAFPDAFAPEVTADLLRRLAALHPTSQPRWEAYDAAWVVRHCAETYEVAAAPPPRLPLLKRLFNRTYLRWRVTSSRPFREDGPGPLAPVAAHPEALEAARTHLVRLIRTAHGLGARQLEGRTHPLHGRLSARQWGALYWKHLDHHLRQFGV
jgi:hypothetical protein